MANLVPSEKRFGRLQYDVVGISPIFFSPASFMIVEVVGQEGHRRDPSSKRGPLLVLDPGSLFFFFPPLVMAGSRLGHRLLQRPTVGRQGTDPAGLPTVHTQARRDGIAPHGA